MAKIDKILGPTLTRSTIKFATSHRFSTFLYLARDASFFSFSYPADIALHFPRHLANPSAEDVQGRI